MNNSALIGYTGFLGSYLKTQRSFTKLYNSKNIEEIKKQDFDTIFCAGLPAAKWIANKEPEKDLENIQFLQNQLSEVSAKHFVLISTVDVFANPRDVDEDSTVPTEGLNPYGLHRYQFEQFVQETFDNTTILRLPALFGPGLRKNALYDLIHNNCVDQIPREGIFQWYDIRRLLQDIEVIKDLQLVHLPTEPIVMKDIINKLFPHMANAGHNNKAGHYDFHTKYSDRFGIKEKYIASADDTLKAMQEWVKSEQAEKECA